MWAIAPKTNADFVACMEAILDIYCLPYDPQFPQVCMDEQPIQLIAESRVPIPAKPGSPSCYDYEYERKGTASVFMFTEPLAGKRYVNVRNQRTAIDWALEIETLLDVHYPDARKVRLVCDNLNTHTMASLYKAFEPEQARRLASRLEIHYTPKHGSWLNIAECELSVLTRQCLSRRIPDIQTVLKEIRAWQNQRNDRQKGINWRFTTKDARIKLKKLYPKILME